MKQAGPIVIIDDDEDDLEIIESIVKEFGLPNEVKLFLTATDAYEYIERRDVSPFLILSDINMQPQNGFQLRSKVRDHDDLNIKCIPYLFVTTGASPENVSKAYSLSSQGIFQKPNTIEKWRSMIKLIVDYWSQCIAPNDV